MGSTDVNYLKMREMKEREAARNATCPEAQRCHEELADKYLALQSSDPAPPSSDSSPTIHYLWQLGAR